MVGIGAISLLDFPRALKRIEHDVQTDFVFAPHLNAVYRQASSELTDRLTGNLKSGHFEPRLPITLEIPKQHLFSRPGSILWPADRLAYQAVVDSIAPTADQALDRSRVFSSQLLSPDPDGFMFQPAGESYAAFRGAVLEHCGDKKFSHVVKADVSAYYERIYQHILVNLLTSSGCDTSLVGFLEKLLLQFTQKDSHGILQGLAPSDFLGTFYLLSIDAAHTMDDIPFVRYVDDMRIFFGDESAAIRHFTRLTALLRNDGLNLNESKSGIVEVTDFITEETELDTLFQAAKNEVREQLSRMDFYASVDAWEFDEPNESSEIEEEEIDLDATYALFGQTDVSDRVRSKIDSFCLSVFTASKDDHAVEYVVSKFAKNPGLAQNFARYLAIFLPTYDAVVEIIEDRFTIESLRFEYQLLWLGAALMSANSLSSTTVDRALQYLLHGKVGECGRAVCASLVGRFGNAGQRRLLRTHYANESSAFVRAAILYSARFFPSAERDSCFTAWGGHDEANALIVIAAKKK
jgi:hypothetical protein